MKIPKNLSVDSVVEFVVGLGVPGLILYYVCAASGFAGAAAITSTLAAFGGPGGMIGGVITFGAAAFIMRAISKLGTENLSYLIIDAYYKKGMTKEELLREIENSPLISKDLKKSTKRTY